jgi:hypothetical protein
MEPGSPGQDVRGAWQPPGQERRRAPRRSLPVQAKDRGTKGELGLSEPQNSR